jgi:hypothetical protein
VWKILKGEILSLSKKCVLKCLQIVTVGNWLNLGLPGPVNPGQVLFIRLRIGIIFQVLYLHGEIMHIRDHIAIKYE